MCVIPGKTHHSMSNDERCMSTNMFTTKSIIITPISAAINTESRIHLALQMSSIDVPFFRLFYAASSIHPKYDLK